MSDGVLAFGWLWLRRRRRSSGPAKHRRAGRPTNQVTVQRRAVAMTDTGTALAHLVTEDAAVAGRRGGRYVGVCGAVVLPGSLLQDTDRYCRCCQAWAAQR